MFAVASKFPFRGFRPVTWTVVGGCAILTFVQALQQPPFSSTTLQHYGAHPALIVFDLLPWNVDSPAIIGSLFTSLFIHGGIVAAAMNILFLAYFGPAIEALMGAARYATFYLLCATAGTMVQCLPAPDSFAALVGADSGIAGVLVAHLLIRPWQRFRFPPLMSALNRFTVWPIISLWFLYQLFEPLTDGVDSPDWLAPVGGAVAGMMLAPAFFRPIPSPPISADDPEGQEGRAVEGRLAFRWPVGMAILFAMVTTALLIGVRAGADAHTVADAGEWIALARIEGISVPHRPEAGLARYREAAALDGKIAADLGDLLQTGKGVPRNQAEAVTWFKRGAEAGQPNAIRAYAIALIDGDTVPANPVQGIALLTDLANNGNGPAEVALGIVVEEGRGGISADPERAAVLYRKACETTATTPVAQSAKPPGCYRLALLLLSGRGVTKDPELGRKLLKRAANAHLPEAENAFGLLLATGDARADDISPEARRQDARARAWFASAAQAGNADAMYNLARFDQQRPGPKSMGPEEIRQWYERSASAGSPKAAAALRKLNQP